jgi:hypothetical protein
MYRTLMPPPYTFAPEEVPLLLVKAMQFEHSELLTWTLISLADVAPHTLLLEANPPALLQYAPMYSTLMPPPYAFAPSELPPLLVEASQSTIVLFRTET